MGYSRAGYEVFGVDLFHDYSQHRYPFPGYKGDAVAALEHLLDGGKLTFKTKGYAVRTLGLEDIDVVTASPPCQVYSVTRHTHDKTHPDLIAPVRTLLRATGRPYVMENVVGATLKTPLLLCGTEFRLHALDKDGRPLYLRRHRLFESDVFLVGKGGCRCRTWRTREIGVGGVYGGGTSDRAKARYVRRGGYTPHRDIRAELIGADWMTQRGLSQAIPPAYTEWIGRQLMETDK